jgi:hypothetical protein
MEPMKDSSLVSKTTADDAPLLSTSPAVCRAMARFYRALARKAMAAQDFTLAAENLRAAELWRGASQQKDVSSNAPT